MQNLQMIEVRYLAPTDTKGARIKLIDTRFEDSIVLARSYDMDSKAQAIQFLTDAGFNLVASSFNNINKTDYLFTDSFKPIK